MASNVKGVLSWFKREKKSGYGNSVFRINPGYSLKNPDSRWKFTSDQMWMDVNNDHKSSAGERFSDNVPTDISNLNYPEDEKGSRFLPMDTDYESYGRALQNMPDISPVEEEDISRQIAPDITGKSYTSDISVNQVLFDIDDASSSIVGQEPDKQLVTDSVDVPQAGKEPSINKSSGIEDTGFVMEGKITARQISTDISSGSPLGKQNINDKVSHNLDKISPKETEQVKKQSTPDIRIKPLASKESNNKISSDTSSIPLKKKEPFGKAAPEVLSKNHLTPINKETNKEGHMEDTYYIARDGNESNLVQRMHPGSTVSIPNDYDEAIEEIRTCPLNCPYRALEFAVLDQKALQRRPK